MSRIINRKKTGRTIPVIGRIKTGYKDVKGLPKSTDYFIASGNYSQKFNDAFGEKPNQIEICFVSDDISQVCHERYEIRTTKKFDGVGGRIFAKGDGENFTVWSKEKCFREVSIIEDPDIMKKVSDYLQSDWRVCLTLRFMIMKIKGVLGLWQYETHAENSTIPSIIDAFDFVKDNAGRVSMIPFDLKVEKVVSQKVGTNHSFPVVTLIPNISRDNMELIAEMTDQTKINKVLTDENIDKMKIDQIEYEGDYAIEK